MTLTMSHLTSRYYDNGKINEQNSNLISSSQQLKFTDGLHYQLLLATSTDDWTTQYGVGRHMTQQRERVIM